MMPLEVLKAGILFAMKENLNIQFVYPKSVLPQDYLDAIDSIDHVDIKPIGADGPADVVVADYADIDVSMVPDGSVVVLRLTLDDMKASLNNIRKLLHRLPRLNLVLKGIDKLKTDDLDSYQKVLSALTDEMVDVYTQGQQVQLNVLTDQLLLGEMNNCGAGDSSLTLAPNGQFYVCPAFYYDDPQTSVGSIEKGLQVKNKQLYTLDYAPLCRCCEAYHCRRCIWLNNHQTMDVNTPGHEQCVVSHLERNASRQLLIRLKEQNYALEFNDLKEIDYLDPINKLEQWRLEKLWGK